MRTSPDGSPSGFRTILAYRAKGFETRINHYSSTMGSFLPSIPYGNVKNNNVKVLNQRRFLMAAVDDEDVSCEYKPCLKQRSDGIQCRYLKVVDCKLTQVSSSCPKLCDVC